MKSQIYGRKLGRNTNQRRALFRNLVYSLLLHGQLKTTTAKAKTIKLLTDKLLKKAKINNASQRRQLLKFFASERRLKILDSVMGKLEERPSGFTRLVKIGRRRGDNAPLARLELLFKKDFKKKNAEINPTDKKKPS